MCKEVERYLDLLKTAHASSAKTAAAKAASDKAKAAAATADAYHRAAKFVSSADLRSLEGSKAVCKPQVNGAVIPLSPYRSPLPHISLAVLGAKQVSANGIPSSEHCKQQCFLRLPGASRLGMGSAQLRL